MKEVIIPISFDFKDNQSRALFYVCEIDSLYDNDKKLKYQTFLNNFDKNKELNMFTDLKSLSEYIKPNKKYLIFLRLKVTSENLDIFSLYNPNYPKKQGSNFANINLNAPNLDQYCFIDIVLYQHGNVFYPKHYEFSDNIDFSSFDQGNHYFTNDFKAMFNSYGINII